MIHTHGEAVIAIRTIVLLADAASKPGDSFLIVLRLFFQLKIDETEKRGFASGHVRWTVPAQHLDDTSTSTCEH